MTEVSSRNGESTEKIVRCSCGAELRNTDEQTLIRETQSHASAAHKLDLSDEQVTSMMEVAR